MLKLSVKEKMPKREISKQLWVLYSTVWRIIRRFHCDPNMMKELFKQKLVNLQFWKRAQRVVLEFIKYNEYPYNWSILQKLVYRETGIQLSKQSVLWFLKNDLNLSFKRISSRLVKDNDKIIRLKRIIFCIEYSNMINNKIVVVNIDETLFSNFTKNNYNWATKGRSAWWQNILFTKYISMIAAITSRGELNYSTLVKNNNSINYISYLTKLTNWLTKDLKFKNSQIVLLMDNSSIHTSKKCQEFLNSLKWLTIYLPTYSPEYAPIEYLFNLVKQSFINRWSNRIIKLKSEESKSNLDYWMKSISREVILSFWIQTTKNIQSTIN